MFTGQDICDWTTGNTLELIHATVTTTPQDIVTLNPNVPQALGMLIHMMLAKNKQDRVQVSPGDVISLTLSEHNKSVQSVENNPEELRTWYKRSCSNKCTRLLAAHAKLRLPDIEGFWKV